MLTRILAVTTVVLAALVVHQYSRMDQLRYQAAQSYARGAKDQRAELQKLVEAQAPEIRRTVAWLNTFYQSQQGLQRPGGLWIDGHPDYEGLSTWVFQVYLTHRFDGESEEQARESMTKAIMATDEWKAKHR